MRTGSKDVHSGFAGTQTSFIVRIRNENGIKGKSFFFFPTFQTNFT